jgi:colanic acid/amylovoran biosynthesis protein
MNVLIVNQPLNNHGDQSAHRAFMHKLISRLPDNNYNVVFLNTADKNVDAVKIQANNVKYTNIKANGRGIIKLVKFSLKHNNLSICKIQPILSSYMKMAKNADAIICCPGGICMGGFMDWRHIWQLWVGMYYGKDIYYFGRSIGPFHEKDNEHELFKRISYQLIKYFKFVSLRDDVSYNLAKSITPKAFRTVDSAFLECPEAEVPYQVKKSIGEDYVVFVPNELVWHYNYKDINQSILRKLYVDIIKKINDLFHGCNIVMLPQLYNQDINDYAYFQKLKEESSLDNIILVDDFYDSDIQQAIIRNSRFVIGGRYHSVIFAINNKVPFLALSYEHKMKGLLEILDLSENQVDFDDIVRHINNESIETILNATKLVMNDVDKIKNSKEKAATISEQVFDKMVEMILQQRTA